MAPNNRWGPSVPRISMDSDMNPFSGLERQFERMQEQIEQAMKLWNIDQFGMPGSETARMGVDLADHGDEYVLTADVPGFEKEDIDVQLSEKTLHITAEQEQETETDAEFYLKSERTRRSLRRSVRVPDSIDEGAVEATYRNGVLTVTLPKREPTDVDGQTIDIE